MTNPFSPILQQIPDLSLEALAERVHRFRGKRLLVLGDLMLDEYIWGEVSRISPEAPVPVVEVRRHTYGLGGGANVANNLQALGGRVKVAGLIGSDPLGQTLTQELVQAGLDTSCLLIDPNRPTTSKLRVVAHSHMNSQQIVRVDRESREKIGEETARALLERVMAVLPEVDAVLISDYNKGVWVPALALPLLIACRDRGIPAVVNVKPPNAACVSGAALVTMNHYEAGQAVLSLPSERWTSGRPSDFTESRFFNDAGQQLREAFGCDTLFITQGARGMTVFGPEGSRHIPPIPAEVYDGTGAGDTVVSIATLALASGGNRLEAAVLGNAGGAIQVHKLGAVAVYHEELLTLILEGKIEMKGSA